MHQPKIDIVDGQISMPMFNRADPEQKADWTLAKAIKMDEVQYRECPRTLPSGRRIEYVKSKKWKTRGVGAFMITMEIFE